MDETKTAISHPSLEHNSKSVQRSFLSVFGDLSIRIPDQDWVRDLMGKADSSAGQWEVTHL